MKNKLIITFICTVLFSCKKDKPVDTTTQQEVVGNLTLQFDQHVGADTLILNTKNYVNEHSDTFNVKLFNYYISNIQLKATDNTVYTEPESYHLVKADNNTTWKFQLAGVPLKNFVSISFMIGVDSLRNVSGAQSGALDPLYGMFWDWNTGYIMSKFEGTSPQSTAAGKKLMYHVGGFSGPENTVKKVDHFLPQAAIVAAGTSPKIIIKADLLEWFKTPVVIDFSKISVIHMPGTEAATVASNYKDMFSIKKIVN